MCFIAPSVLSFIRCNGITLVLSLWGSCGFASGVNYEVSCYMPQAFRPICAIEPQLRSAFGNFVLLIILSLTIRQYIVWFIEIVLNQSIKYLMISWRRITVCCTPHTCSQRHRYFGSSGATIPGRRVQGTTKWSGNKYFKWKNWFFSSTSLKSLSK
jgi:hypothetical protein